MFHDAVQHIHCEGCHSIQFRGSAEIGKDTDEEGSGGGCWTAGNGVMFAWRLATLVPSIVCDYM